MPAFTPLQPFRGASPHAEDGPSRNPLAPKGKAHDAGAAAGCGAQAGASTGTEVGEADQAPAWAGGGLRLWGTFAVR